MRVITKEEGTEAQRGIDGDMRSLHSALQNLSEDMTEIANARQLFDWLGALHAESPGVAARVNAGTTVGPALCFLGAALEAMAERASVNVQEISEVLRANCVAS